MEQDTPNQRRALDFLRHDIVTLAATENLCLRLTVLCREFAQVLHWERAYLAFANWRLVAGRLFGRHDSSVRRGFGPALRRALLDRDADGAAPPDSLLSAIRVNRMNNKDAGAKQAENCNNCFNHLTNPRYAYCCKHPLADVCFTTASSGSGNDFVGPAA